MARSRFGRFTLVVATSLGLLFFLAGPAEAHVEATADRDVAGQPATLTLQVEGERSNATTTKVQAVIESSAPVQGITAPPVKGWSAVVDEAARPQTVTWTGSAVSPSSSESLLMNVAALPYTDRLIVKVLQTYSNGEIARWIAVPQEGEPEPEYPASVIKLKVPATIAPPASDSPPPAPEGPLPAASTQRSTNPRIPRSLSV